MTSHMTLSVSPVIFFDDTSKFVIVTCKILPGEGKTVHDEGSGEPVEVHDQGVQS